MTDTPPAETHDVVSNPNGSGDGDEPSGLDEQWQLYSSGGASVKIDGRVYRLRRPDMGQIKVLREALASAADTIRHESDAGEIVRRLNKAQTDRINAELTELEADNQAEGYAEKITALVNELQEVSDRDLKRGREITNLVDEQYQGWWKFAFETLCFPGSDGVRVPERWPSWVADATAVQQIMQHWRSNPLARG
jgi:hypothetical protein